MQDHWDSRGATGTWAERSIASVNNGEREWEGEKEWGGERGSGEGRERGRWGMTLEIYMYTYMYIYMYVHLFTIV